MRLRLSWLRRRGDSQGSVRPMPEEVQGWAESFHNLMASKWWCKRGNERKGGGESEVEKEGSY
ncbi:hypothetical protein E2C01_089176 [Portunus trituberculatus]|uniref:Uncharacterized protein n=1 Tax=Portunus trituberculatus TaxID=210409 RepID=A0A5B7JHF9_PORTR|nr:hypothetical protein [Portunus trituberculatus]